MRTDDRSRSTRTFTATEAKHHFGQVIRHAQRKGPVFITKHNRTEAVVLSAEEYSALTELNPVDLHQLEDEFDALFDEMQTSAFSRGADKVFAMDSVQLGRSALHGQPGK